MVKPIGILGGTFDPIHNGHLRLALEIYQTLELAEIRLIPVHTPPHRATPSATAEQRLAMLQLAINDTEGLTVDDREIQHGDTSYTIDTVRSLRNNFADHSLCLIIGMDAFQSLNTWRNWTLLLNDVHIVVANRSGNSLEFEHEEVADFFTRHVTENHTKLHTSTAGCIVQINIPTLDISSSRIRHLISSKQSIHYLLPEKVVSYIQQESLYLDNI